VSLLYTGEDQVVNGQPVTALLRVTTDQWALESDLTPDQFYAFAEAILAHESHWKADAYHFDGPDKVLNASYGLMQVEGVTAVSYGAKAPDIAAGSLYDVPTNLAYGVRRLAEGLARQGGDLSLAAADYNEGPGNVAKGYADTAYVQDVLAKYQAYYSANTGAADPGVTVTPQTAGFAGVDVVTILVVLGLAGAALYVGLSR